MAFTKLDAVNRMLRAAGEQPVSTLVSDSTNDVDIAVQVLDEATMQVLGQGIPENTVKLTLTPTTDGFVYLPSTVLYADADPDDTTWRDRNVNQRGNRLFDNDNNTFVFTTETVKVTVKQMLEFNDLPLHTQMYIADMAARQYQMDTKGDPDVDARLAQRVLESQAAQRINELRSRDICWTDQAGGAGIMGGRYGSRGTRRRYT